MKAENKKENTETYEMVVELIKYLNVANTKGAFNLQESTHIGTIANALLEKYKD